MAEAKRFFTERDIEELLRPNDKSNADFISNLAVASLLRGREESQDKTAVGKLYRKEPLYWENPRDERMPAKDMPFESQLQRDAIRRQKEAEPQSGHVDNDFYPWVPTINFFKDVKGFPKDLNEFIQGIKGRNVAPALKPISPGQPKNIPELK